MKLAFETGSDPKFVYPFGHTALHRCGEFGNTECAEMLLLKGAEDAADVPAVRESTALPPIGKIAVINAAGW